MWKNVASQKLPNFLFTPLHENGHNFCSSWANWKISLPKSIYYSRAICWYPQITRGHVSHAWKRVSKFLNFDMKKLKKPDFFDLTVNEVFKYTLLAFRKHRSLFWSNFLNCLNSVGKCAKYSCLSWGCPKSGWTAQERTQFSPPCTRRTLSRTVLNGLSGIKWFR